MVSKATRAHPQLAMSLTKGCRNSWPDFRFTSIQVDGPNHREEAWGRRVLVDSLGVFVKKLVGIVQLRSEKTVGMFRVYRGLFYTVKWGLYETMK